MKYWIKVKAKVGLKLHILIIVGTKDLLFRRQILKISKEGKINRVHTIREATKATSHEHIQSTTLEALLT